MLTIFRIVDTATPIKSKPASLGARHLAAIYNHILDTGVPTELEAGEVEGIAMNFEFNANSVSLAKFAQIFVGRDDLLAIAEEAQFHGRSLRISKGASDHFASLCVSEHIALSPEITMSKDRADSVLKCLGLDRETSGTISITRLREVLSQTAIRQKFSKLGLDAAYDYLASYCAIEHGNTDPMLAWV